jgi:hypothetical protein
MMGNLIEGFREMSVSCKILEHVIHSQIMDHFERWNILTDKQHGFRRRRSCESQLMGNLIEGFREIKQDHINLFSFGQGLG